MTERTSASIRRSLELLSSLGQIVSSGKSLETVLYGTVNLIRTMLNVERCSILIIDHDCGHLRLKAASSIPVEEWEKIRIPVGEGICGRVSQDGRPLLVEDIRTSDFSEYAHPERYSTNSFMCVPLIIKGHTVGVINVNNETDRRTFNHDDLDLVTALAGLIALTIENARLFSASEDLRSHLENVVENLHLAVLTLDTCRCVTHINSRLVRLLALNTERAIEGLTVDAIMPEALLGAVDELINDTIRFGTDARVEIEFASPLFGRIPLEIFLSAFSDAQGKVDGVLMTFIDTSMRREVDELRRIDEMKSNFMSMVSHELRTPLTAIKGAVHLLSHSHATGLSCQQSNLIDMINNNTERLVRLVNDLLDMVNIENQSLALIRKPYQLISIVTGCLDNFRIAAGAKQITIHEELEPAVATVDKERISQAISQLIDNAIKFSPKGGWIRVRTGIMGSYGIICVRDSGSGIAPDVKPRLFSKFFQAQNPMTRSVSGTGIGLYMAKSIVELHGGRITLREPEENGSEFMIQVPLSNVAEEQTLR